VRTEDARATGASLASLAVTRGLGVIVFAAVLLTAACGGGDPIPLKSADTFLRGLDEVEQKVRARECRQANPALRRLGQTARELPASVDEATRATLTAGFARLRELVRTQCKPKRKSQRRKEPEPVTPSPPAQTTPEPAPPRTESPTQTEPTPAPEQPEVPQSEPQTTPEPQQPTSPAPPQMPEIPEIPEVPGLPN
jgi:hypothetical protein